MAHLLLLEVGSNPDPQQLTPTGVVMLGRQLSFAVAVVALLWVVQSVPLVAQETARGWTFIAGGGYATQFDEQGSFSLSASALQARSPTLFLGIESGYDRHQAFETGGETYWNGTNVTGECPTPCTWQRVRFTDKNIRASWHLSGVLRFYPSTPARTVVPSAELGLGIYGIRSSGGRQVRDATTGAPVPELSGEGSSIDVAPGMGVGFGVDVFPGNGRIGVGAVARLRGAALPTGDGLFASGFASLQARVTVR
ncbi:MAG TPA: hypothetical protein VFH26_10325 [Gemmatimonadales bacterium]|nr:hypothetical protein [Gemmatimonadales bacterium]